MAGKLKKKRRVWLRVFLALALLGFVGAGVAVWGVYLHYAKGLPTLNGLADYRPSLVTRVFARDYQLLGEFFLERRQFIPLSEVPRTLIQAFLAIEDSKFYHHFGFDPVGMFRALIANVRAGRKVQGGSTITQQVARTFLLSSIKKWSRKIKEIILAIRIERRFSKEEILELYTNQIFLGAGSYGVAAAARIYYNRDVSELTLAQMALLAGLPKGPNRYSPWKHPKRAKKRQNLVLKRMVEVGFITPEQGEAAAAAPLELAHPPAPLERVAPHFLEYVRRQIQQEWGNQQLYNGGLDVFTTLDPPLQRLAQDAIRRGLIQYDRRHGYRGPLSHIENLTPAAADAWLVSVRDRELTVAGYWTGLVTGFSKKGNAELLLSDGRKANLSLKAVAWARKRVGKKKMLGPTIKAVTQVLAEGDVVLVEPLDGEDRPFKLAQEPDAEGALLALDPHTGQILAMVGGYDFGRSEFNRATQARRQPGSAFKPFLYAAAMDQGMTPVSRIDDTPMPIIYQDADTGERKLWRAENYGRKFHGPTTLRMGLVHSRNLVTIRLLKKIGLKYAVKYLQRFGFHIPENRRDLSLSLGTMGFSPLQMASAYAVFANGGKLVEPVYIARVQDSMGRTVFRHGGGDCLLCHQEPQSQNMDKPENGSHMFGRRVLDPATAYQVSSMLRGVVQMGTGRKARVIRRPLAGKTGTTNDLRDTWFIGFSPSIVACVWVGMDDFTVLGRRETGSATALPIWIDFMKRALKNRPINTFPVPPGIHLEAVDAETGGPVSATTKIRVYEAFKKGQGPNEHHTQVSSENPVELEGGMY